MAARPRTGILPLQGRQSFTFLFLLCCTLVRHSHGDGSIAAVDPTSANGNVAIVGTLPRVCLGTTKFWRNNTHVLEYVCGPWIDLACHISHDARLYGNEIPLVEWGAVTPNEQLGVNELAPVLDGVLDALAVRTHWSPAIRARKDWL